MAADCVTADVLLVRERVARPAYEALKRALDVALALPLLLVTLPIMIVAGLLVRLTSPGPALYTQTRVGRHGRHYTIYKLRTMLDGCERSTGPRWAAANDPRVTRVGRLLRRTHLDELPQLWNVLRGDMSLVGPRPERPEFVARLRRALPDYGQRLAVRPGVTGLAQVQLPADTDLASVRRKLAHDLHYIDRLGLWLDLRILAATILYVLGVRYQTLGRLLALTPTDAVRPQAINPPHLTQTHPLLDTDPVPCSDVAAVEFLKAGIG